MLYKNVNTGAIVDVQCELAGAWKLVEKKTEVKEQPVEKKEPKAKTKKSNAK